MKLATMHAPFIIRLETGARAGSLVDSASGLGLGSDMFFRVRVRVRGSDSFGASTICT